MTLALTRAGTVGPVARAVAAAGGSVERLLGRVDLPPSILERPETLVLLRDQFRLVEEAARMIGDDALPARLSVAAGLSGLGAYGHHVMSYPDLGSALAQSGAAFGHLLQASTRLELEIREGTAIWSYRITAPLTVGRQKNELLALGYMLDILRRFAGEDWIPHQAEIPGTLAGRRAIEEILRCPVRAGPLAAVVFPARYLDCPAPSSRPASGAAAEVPAETAAAAVTTAMIALEREAGRFGIAAVAARLGMTQRTLQRRLAAAGTTFSTLAEASDFGAAAALMRGEGLSITETAARLGYADVAHFSRAFRRWSGVPPSRWKPAVAT